MGLPAYRIVVDHVSEGEVANLIRGYVEIGGSRVRFSGVAYGRFGGQNFSPQFSKAARETLAKLAGDFPRFEDDVQMRLMRGEFDAKPNKEERHRHLHPGQEGTES